MLVFKLQHAKPKPSLSNPRWLWVFTCSFKQEQNDCTELLSVFLTENSFESWLQFWERGQGRAWTHAWLWGGEVLTEGSVDDSGVRVSVQPAASPDDNLDACNWLRNPTALGLVIDVVLFCVCFFFFLNFTLLSWAAPSFQIVFTVWLCLIVCCLHVLNSWSDSGLRKQTLSKAGLDPGKTADFRRSNMSVWPAMLGAQES